ncbi:transposon Tf2-6 polyprotein [Trichonephila clavipes]|nr:transposon Tf2-6 polyprotein [Trichonephila clavipes]
MDDLLIPSQNEAEGLNKLRLVLQTAADFGLELNLKKCNFLQRKIEFLGYIIENGTIKPSPSKTHAVQNFPQPQTPRQLQSFIGLTRRFTCSPAPRTAWSSGCPCGYQLLADHFRSHDRTEVTRGSQPKWRDSPLPAAISTR